RLRSTSKLPLALACVLLVLVVITLMNNHPKDNLPPSYLTSKDDNEQRSPHLASPCPTPPPPDPAPIIKTGEGFLFSSEAEIFAYAATRLNQVGKSDLLVSTSPLKKYAYVYYATNNHYLCSAIINL